MVLLGLLAGAGGGLLGIGGSIILIPGLVLIHGGEGQHLYQAAAMIVNFFVVAPAVWRHRRAGALVGDVTRWTVPSAAAGAMIGVFLSELPQFRGAGRGYLQLGFAGFLLYALVTNLLRLREKRPPRHRTGPDGKPVSAAVSVGLVGLPAGMIGGLLGVGGGILAVPAQQICLRMPLRNAIANSSATILFSSVVGGLAKNAALSRHGYGIGDSIGLAVILIPSAMLGSWIAAAGVHRWPVRAIRLVFALLLACCAVRMGLAAREQLASERPSPVESRNTTTEVLAGARSTGTEAAWSASEDRCGTDVRPLSHTAETAVPQDLGTRS